jgi:hypothetical protein
MTKTKNTEGMFQLVWTTRNFQEFISVQPTSNWIASRIFRFVTALVIWK